VADLSAPPEPQPRSGNQLNNAAVWQRFIPQT
jgi:hypothetical protein